VPAYTKSIEACVKEVNTCQQDDMLSVKQS